MSIFQSAWVSFHLTSAAALVSWLATYLIDSTILLGVAWLLSLLFRRQPALEEAIWKAALVAALAAATLSSAMGIEPLGGHWSISRNALVEQTASVASNAATGTPVLVTARSTAIQPLGAGLDAALDRAAEAGSAVATAATPVSPWWRPILLLWLIGAALFTMILIASWTRLLWMLRTRRDRSAESLGREARHIAAAGGWRRRPRVTSSIVLRVPIALGWRRPEVCLPERVGELPSEQRSGLLAHEVAHLMRRDPLWRFVAWLLESVFFFQPLHRLARRRLEECSEFLCDQWAISQTGSALGFAECLASVADWSLAAERLPVPAMARSGSLLGRRVERILDGGSARLLRSGRWWIVAAVVLALAVGSAAPVVRAESTAPPAPAAAAAEPAPATAPSAAPSSRAPSAPALAPAPRIAAVPTAPAEASNAPQAYPGPAPSAAPSPPTAVSTPAPRSETEVAPRGIDAEAWRSFEDSMVEMIDRLHLSAADLARLEDRITALARNGRPLSDEELGRIRAQVESAARAMAVRRDEMAELGAKLERAQGKQRQELERQLQAMRESLRSELSGSVPSKEELARIQKEVEAAVSQVPTKEELAQIQAEVAKSVPSKEELEQARRQALREVERAQRQISKREIVRQRELAQEIQKSQKRVRAQVEEQMRQVRHELEKQQSESRKQLVAAQQELARERAKLEVERKEIEAQRKALERERRKLEHERQRQEREGHPAGTTAPPAPHS